MGKYIVVSTTSNNKMVLNNISKILLEKRLVSCAQVFNIESTYWWNGDLVDDSEYLLKMKTRKDLYKGVEKIILDNHNYELPEVIFCDIDGYDKYLKWIDEETR